MMNHPGGAETRISFRSSCVAWCFIQDAPKRCHGLLLLVWETYLAPSRLAAHFYDGPKADVKPGKTSTRSARPSSWRTSRASRHSHRHHHHHHLRRRRHHSLPRRDSPAARCTSPCATLPAQTSCSAQSSRLSCAARHSRPMTSSRSTTCLRVRLQILLPRLLHHHHHHHHQQQQQKQHCCRC